MVSGLEAQKGTSDPDPVLFLLYHDGEHLSLPGPEMNENSVPIYISHSALQVCCGLNETISAGLRTQITMHIIVYMGKRIRFSTPTIFTDLQTDECVSWKIRAKIV